MDMHLVDYAVFAGSLLVTMIIGVVYMFIEWNSTSKSYFRGDQQMSTIPVMFSLFASFISAITLVGASAEMYVTGLRLSWYALAAFAGTFGAAFIFVPFMYRIKLRSTMQYAIKRYNSPLLRNLKVFFAFFGVLFYQAVCTYTPCVALAAVTPIKEYYSILAIGVVTIFYTTVGGVKAVVWVDAIQTLLMFAGTVFITVAGVNQNGGIDHIWEVTSSTDYTKMWDDKLDLQMPVTFASVCIGTLTFKWTLFATSQASWQRYTGLTSAKKAIIAVAGSGPLILGLYVILAMNSMAMFTHYWELGCSPYNGHNKNRIMSIFSLNVARPYLGVMGLYFSALFSGALSSLSTCFNTLASVLWEDAFKGKIGHRLNKFQTNVFIKSLSLALGLLTCAIALMLPAIGGSVIEMVFIFSPLFFCSISASYICGMLCPYIGRLAAIGGVTVGFILHFLLVLPKPFVKTSFRQALIMPNDKCPGNTNSSFVLDDAVLTGMSDFSGYPHVPGDNLTIGGTFVAPAPIYDEWKWAPTWLLYLWSLSYFIMPFLVLVTTIIVMHLLVPIAYFIDGNAGNGYEAKAWNCVLWSNWWPHDDADDASESSENDDNEDSDDNETRSKPDDTTSFSEYTPMQSMTRNGEARKRQKTTEDGSGANRRLLDENSTSLGADIGVEFVDRSQPHIHHVDGPAGTFSV